MAPSRTSSRKRKQQQKNWMILLAVVVLVVAGIVLGVKFLGRDAKEPADSGSSDADAVSASLVNPLTGETDGFSGGAAGKRPVAFMVNNAPAARPQWGLCTPDIVVEGLVEGGASRMMWLYADANAIPKVGSMRSARHDFVEFANGLDAIFVHWGGSTFAYEAIKQQGIDDIDGISYSEKYFFRDEARRSQGVAIEHTGYTTGESIRKAISDLGIRTHWKEEKSSPFQFGRPGETRTLGGGACTSVMASFSGSYAHTFRYSAEDGLYANYMNDKPMTQDGGEQMKVKNVLLLYCGTKSMGTDAGHIDMDLTGGSGVYLSNGTYEPITWKKGGPTDQLRLLAADGSALTLNTGKSWIGLIPSERESKTVLA